METFFVNQFYSDLIVSVFVPGALLEIPRAKGMTGLKDLGNFRRVRRTPGVRIFRWSPNSFGGGSGFGTLTFRWNWSDDTCGRTVSRCSFCGAFYATKHVIKPKDSAMKCSESIIFTEKTLIKKRRQFSRNHQPKMQTCVGYDYGC